MALWNSCNIDIPRSFNSRDSFVRRKFENRALISCRSGPILSTLHAKVTEEIDLEMCSYGQLSEVQMLRDLDLDLASGQGHVNIHSTCRTTCMLNHVTVVSRTIEIWPFEFRQILKSDQTRLRKTLHKQTNRHHENNDHLAVNQHFEKQQKNHYKNVNVTKTSLTESQTEGK